MKESKKLVVAPGEETYYINTYSCFGWEMVSSQEVKVKDSHVENRGGTLYSVTVSENYVNIMLSRDTAIPNYDKLNALQNQFESALAGMKARKRFNLIIAIIGLALWGIGLVLYIVYYITQNKKIDENNRNCRQRMDKAVSDARAIVG